MDGIAAFLRRFPPFDRLPADEVERAAGAAGLVDFAPGATILLEDGPPARHVYVVRAGAVELVHDGEVVDTLETGEIFGHPSVLTAMAPAFTVRARDAATCVLLPAEAAMRLLSMPAGVAFVASTLRERMVRTGYVAHALADVRTAHVGSLLHRPAAVCRPDTPIGEAAGIMAERDVSCVLVDCGDHYGVVTDSDLRSRVIAAGRSPDEPVSAIMTAPARTSEPERLAVDAMIDMLDSGIHHLPVVTADGSPLGVVTATDLMYLEARTPFALRRSVAQARTPDAVVQAARALPQVVSALVRAGVAAVDIGRVMALQSDTVTTRLLELHGRELGEPPAAWAWMALGSVARREQSLASDQDNALAYDDDAGEGADAWFERLAEAVNGDLARAGFGPDNAGVLARNRQWRMSASDWAWVFRECLEQPDKSHLVRAAVAFDFRHVAGGLNVVPPLAGIEREAHGHAGFIARLARTATDFEPPLGFRGKLAVPRSGPHPGRIDLKSGGIVPIANLARFHALAAGITVPGTLDRLDGAAAAGALPPERASELREAFAIVVRLRLEHQVAQVDAGETPDNLLDPSSLSPLTRWQLQEAFRAVAGAQKALSRYVPIGL